MRLEVLDIILVSLLIFFSIRGWIRGVIRELFGLTGLFVSCAAGLRFGLTVSEAIENFLRLPPFVSLCAGVAIVFLLVWLFFFFTSRILVNKIRRSSAGWLDRFGGFLIGSAKGLLLAGLVALGVFHLSVLPGQGRRESVLSRPFRILVLSSIRMAVKFSPLVSRFSESLTSAYQGITNALDKDPVSEQLETFQEHTQKKSPKSSKKADASKP